MQFLPNKSRTELEIRNQFPLVEIGGVEKLRFSVGRGALLVSVIFFSLANVSHGVRMTLVHGISTITSLPHLLIENNGFVSLIVDMSIYNVPKFFIFR